MKQIVLDQPLYRPMSLEDLEEMEADTFGFSVLEGHQVACFDSGGEKFLCLPQVLEIVKHASMEMIDSTIAQFSLVLVECSPLKLEILHRHRILSRDVTFCGLMSQSNAERLCKILNSVKVQRQPIFKQRKSITPSKHQHRIRVVHDCFGHQKGILFPQLYVSPNSSCIECFNCGEIFAPNDFVGHTHSRCEGDHDSSLCHWGFNSRNWRWYLRLADDTSRSEDEELSLKEYLDEIKCRYVHPIDDPLLISHDHERHSPADSESMNTSPSLPTPPSLSPPSGPNRDIQQSGSIFQQCIMKIYNTPLENNEDRHQILNYLVMLRQEHLKQISSLVSERQKMIKIFMKNYSAQPNTLTENSPAEGPPQEESHTQLLDSVRQKISLFKGSRCVKRQCRSPLSDSISVCESKKSHISLSKTDSEEIPIYEGHQSHSRVEKLGSDPTQLPK